MNKNAEVFWNLTANGYDKIESRLENIYSKIYSNLKRHVRQDDIVLDFACGTGTSSIKIADRVKKIDAIDISSKMLEIAKIKAANSNIKNINFIHSDIYDNRFDCESFDVIIAFGILHLLIDYKQTVSRIRELLKPGGLFISSTPILADKMILIYKMQFLPFYYFSKLRLLPQVLRRFSCNDITTLMTTGQFQIIESEKIYNKMTAYFTVSKKLT